MKTNDSYFDQSKDMATTEYSRFSRRAAILWGIGVFACLSVLGGCGSATKATSNDGASTPHVAVVKVQRRNLSNTLQIAAEFQPFQEISVYAKVSGYIQKLYIDWGKHVNQGQLLAVIEIPELQQQLQLDEAAVRRSEQDLARANEELSRAQYSYNVTHLTYTRLANVQKTRPELVAQQEIDIAQGKDLEASSGVSAAKDSALGSEQGLLVAKASLEKDKAMYAYARISAPFDGVVTEMDAYTGALLPAGTSSNKGDQALCRLSQNDLLRLVIPLPERAVADVHLGETVAVQVSAKNRTFNGKIVRFSDQIDTTTRTMHTEIDVPNLTYELVPGMYATVDVPLHTARDVLTVPLQAVQISQVDRGAVLVVDANNRIERRDITLGLQSATSAEVTSGLKENDLVVFGEQSQFKTGELVVPQAVTPSEME
jgi:RND family efflux transporter MFP subunit